MPIDSHINPADIQRDIANDLVKSVVAALWGEFGASYTFYIEDVPQGFKTPSFAIVSMNTIKETGLDIRKYWQFAFDVLYFCDTAAARSEWNTVEQRMAQALDWIDFSGKKLRAEIQPSSWDDAEKVGHCYITIGIHLMDVWEQKDKLEMLANSNGEYIAGDKTCLTTGG